MNNHIMRTVRHLVAACLLLTIGSVQAQIPTLVLALNNETDLVFTAVECENDDGRILFLKDKAGELLLTGCWLRIGDEHIVVKYSDNTRYMYNINSLKKR
jgi:hypothetical protein